MYLWLLMAVSVLVGHGIGIAASKATPDEVDDSRFEIFSHRIRVQRSATTHNRRHFHKHHGERKSSKVVTQCPPPPMTRLPDNACTADPCQSDSECTIQSQKCCYNGCLYACVDVVHSPPVIDWQTRPSEYEKLGSVYGLIDVESDEYEGNLEFDIVPGEMLAESHRGALIGEICSTTVEKGDILLDCPHGYICHVEDRGNPQKGIPDRGRCVLVNEDAPEMVPNLEDEYFY